MTNDLQSAENLCLEEKEIKDKVSKAIKGKEIYYSIIKNNS